VKAIWYVEDNNMYSNNPRPKDPKPIKFFGDGEVTLREPVMVFFDKKYVIICNYSEAGLDVARKLNSKPIHSTLGLALQLIGLTANLENIISENKSFLELIKQLVQ
jgi:hypothetical protein